MGADIEAINRIVKETTRVYRKGEKLYQDGKPVSELSEPHAGLNVVEYFGYPSVPEDKPEMVDMIAIYVRVEANEQQKADLISAIGDGKFDEYGMNLADGLTYIHLGGELGSQELALRFMALGFFLGLWRLMSPKDVGAYGDVASQMFGMGFL